MHEGKVVLTENFGYRDVSNKIPPDQDTVYYLASLSKSFTAAGIAHLVDQVDTMTWDTPVATIYPPLAHEDPVIRQNATIVDFLSHRTGLAPKNHIWSQEYGRFTLSWGDDIDIIRYLEPIAGLRQKWIYNNWGYAVADQIIRHLAITSWGSFLQQHIFDPLGMTRTFTTKQHGDDNIAKAYITRGNGEPSETEEPDGEDGEILAGALAVKSCVRDLSNYYLAFMRALKQVQLDHPEAEEASVFGHAATMVRLFMRAVKQAWDRYSTAEIPSAFIDPAKMIHPFIDLSTYSKELEGSYGLGWATTHLPGTLGALGMNVGYLDQMPIIADGIPTGVNCYYHSGSANSFLSSVHLLPDSESGVVVLTNSMSHNDLADWLGQLYVEHILDSPVKNDFLGLAERSAEAALALWPAMRRELAEKQIPKTLVRPLQKYVGTYCNRMDNYHVSVLERDGELLMRFQQEENIAYQLTHYHHDTFSWLISHERNAEVGRFPIRRASYYLIRFESHGANSESIDSLIWAHDDEVLNGERFFKEGGNPIPRLHDCEKSIQKQTRQL